MPKDGNDGVERRLDNGLESSLRGELMHMGPFLTGVESGSVDGGLLLDDDIPSTAAVTLTVSLEVENPFASLPFC